MNSHSPPFVQCIKTRTKAKPARSYTVIARRLKLATESVNCLGANRRPGVLEPCLEEAFPETLSCPFRMEAEADLERRAVRPLEVEESDQAASLVLDRDVIVASRRRVKQLGKIIRVGRPVVERERVRVMPARDCLRVRLAHQPETERHHSLVAIPFSGAVTLWEIITPQSSSLPA